MGYPGLDPEMALQIVQTLLYCIACILAGFALLALFTYVILLCSEIFSRQRASKTPLAKVPHRVGGASVVEQTHDLVPAGAQIMAEEATVTGGEVLCDGIIRVDFPGISAHHRPLGIDVSNV